MLGAPWKKPEAVRVATALIDSYQQLLGESIFDFGSGAPKEPLKDLYKLPVAVLCHDTSPDPKFIYVNKQAMRWFGRGWPDFIGLPSRKTAEPDERSARAQMLADVERDGYLRGYSGVRITFDRIRFSFTDALLWNVSDADGVRIGQAALIPNHQVLRPKWMGSG